MKSYDALVIGAGHNGLVHAAYLARAGLSVAVLERRPVIGGATLTEEAYPGFKYSVFSYLVSLLRPEVIHELDLVRHGLNVTSLESTYNPLPGGGELFREADAQRTVHSIARHSKRDAENYPIFKREMTFIARLCHRLQDTVPPEIDARVGALDEALLPELAKLFADVPARRRRIFLQMLTQSAEDFLQQWFESEALIAALSTSSIIGSFLSPRSPGSAYVLLHHYMGEVDGVYRGWGWARGGTGAVADAVARAAQSHGAEILTDASVAELLVEDGAVGGVALEDGRELRSRIVTSSAGPQLSLDRFLGDAGRAAMPDLVARARSWQSDGCSGKVNLSLDGVPEFASRPGLGAHQAGGISIAPSVDYIHDAYVEAKAGRPSRRPFVDMVIPSVIDPTMAPPGRHVMSCFVQYLPRRLRDGEGRPADWESEREAVGDAVLDVLSEHIPRIKEQVLHRQVMTPVDVERVAGIPGGNIFHGELKLSQLFLNRPGARGAGFGTPLPGYYLCGSATHPGGGISGAPGRFAAHRVLSDLTGGGGSS
ncbi:MAG: NAD(P)/FAD-dependent oxidoreductase [Acidobacteriota bacterium]